jgi:hypothetical protein
MPENELVHHGNKGIFKIRLRHIFYRAFFNVCNMSGAAGKPIVPRGDGGADVEGETPQK